MNEIIRHATVDEIVGRRNRAHALMFLKPDGELHAIMSAGTEFRETRKAAAFRDLMTRLNARWEDLPAGSFSEVGTNVNTVILRVRRNGRPIY